MFKKILEKLAFIILTSIILISATMLFSNNSYAKETNSWEGNYSKERIIVKYKENVIEAVQWFKNATAKVEEEGTIGPNKDNVKIMKVREGQTVEAALEKYVGDLSVEYAEPDYEYELFLIPNDPDYKNQAANLALLGIQDAWDYTVGDDNIITAIVDSGVVDSHADLQGRIIGWYTPISGVNPKEDYSTKGPHGTGVAGTVVGDTNNGTGIAATTWQGKALAIRVSDNSGTINTTNLANGIRYAVNNGAHIINLSLGSPNHVQTMKEAIDYAYNLGCVVVAASGNENTAVCYPAAYPNVIAVGATANGISKVGFSNYGTTLDVLAMSTYRTPISNGGYAVASGTSFASPQVAGLASLLLGIDSSLTPDQVKDYIRRGASGNGNWVNNEVGYGIVNFKKSIELLIAESDIETITIKYVDENDSNNILYTAQIEGVKIGTIEQYIVPEEFIVNNEIWRTINFGVKTHTVVKGINEIIIEYVNVSQEIVNIINNKFEIEIINGISYIRDINAGTSVGTIIQSLELSDYYKAEITNVDETILINTANVGTECVLIVKNRSEETINDYTIIIKGDISGDGIINFIDIVRLIQYVYAPEENFEWKDAIRMAGKVTGINGNPGFADIMTIIRHCYESAQW